MSETDNMLSVVIPVHNEENSIASCIENIHLRLECDNISHEILVVMDHCTDGTANVLSALQVGIPYLRVERNDGSQGYGMAVRAGLEVYKGDMVAIMMGDSSDDVGDLVTYYRTIVNGAECVFGSRFMKGGRTVGYPLHKLFLNRVVNWWIRFLFRLDFADVTNAFKIYRRHVIDGLKPFLSCHFNLTVELPLKAVIRGYKYEVVPINWYNRKKGVSKLKIHEMGSRYLFIVLYCWLEKHLSRGDYKKRGGLAENGN